MMDGMSFDTLLKATVLIIPLWVLRSLQFKIHFQDKIAAGLHKFMGKMGAIFCGEFLVFGTYKGSVLPVFQVRVRAKMRAKLAPTAFIRYSLVFRLSS